MPWPLIVDADGERALGERGGNQDLTPRRQLHRLDRILDQVDQDLLELDGIDGQEDVLGQLEAQVDLRRVAGQSERPGLADQGIGIDRLAFHRAAVGQRRGSCG